MSFSQTHTGPVAPTLKPNTQTSTSTGSCPPTTQTQPAMVCQPVQVQQQAPPPPKEEIIEKTVPVATTTATTTVQQQKVQVKQQQPARPEATTLAQPYDAPVQEPPPPQVQVVEQPRAYIVQERVAVPVVVPPVQQVVVEEEEEECGCLAGKVALITGGTSGIGLATARLFKQEGAVVVITAKCEESCDKDQCEHVEGFDVVETDITKMQQLNRLMMHIQEKYGGLDVLFANAGVALFKPTNEVDEDFFDAVVSTNFKGTYFTVAKALPILRPGSSVILNSSNVSHMGWPGGSTYAAAKAAVRSLARTWTLEVPPSKVRFNVLSPGAVETRLLDRLGKTAEEAKMVSDAMMMKIPAGRFAQPDEIANIAKFLACPESSYICGAELCADGGWSQV